MKTYCYYIVFEVGGIVDVAEVTLASELEHIHQVRMVGDNLAAKRGAAAGALTVTNWLFLRRGSSEDVSICGECGRLELDPQHDPFVPNSHEFR